MCRSYYLLFNHVILLRPCGVYYVYYFSLSINDYHIIIVCVNQARLFNCCRGGGGGGFFLLNALNGRELNCCKYVACAETRRQIQNVSRQEKTLLNERADKTEYEYNSLSA